MTRCKAPHPHTVIIYRQLPSQTGVSHHRWVLSSGTTSRLYPPDYILYRSFPSQMGFILWDHIKALSTRLHSIQKFPITDGFYPLGTTSKAPSTRLLIYRSFPSQMGFILPDQFQAPSSRLHTTLSSQKQASTSHSHRLQSLSDTDLSFAFNSSGMK